MPLSASAELLKTLVSFDTTSARSNLELIHYVKGLLNQAGIAVELVFNEDKNKANLFATVGPKERPGIVLSGHTDVVPVAGQQWDTEPFQATLKDGKLYGRGTADMKGFVACAIHAFLQAASMDLHTPIHLCLSYDEEVGCIGVRTILSVLAHQLVAPKLCVIGEPTLMQIATGHKGKAVYQAMCRGQEGHSAMAPQYVNAVHVAADVVAGIRATQQHVAKQGAQDFAYEVPYTTLHVGRIAGGKALNIVPNKCVVDFEIRHLAGDVPDNLVQQVEAHVLAQHPDAVSWLDIEEVNHYPGLDTPITLDAVRFLQDCLPDTTTLGKIAFGTEGGLFTHAFACPVLVCGPGAIRVAHKPNEYVALNQLERCDAFLQQLIRRLH